MLEKSKETVFFTSWRLGKTRVGWVGPLWKGKRDTRKAQVEGIVPAKSACLVILVNTESSCIIKTQQ